MKKETCPANGEKLNCKEHLGSGLVQCPLKLKKVERTVGWLLRGYKRSHTLPPQKSHKGPEHLDNHGSDWWGKGAYSYMLLFYRGAVA